MNNADRAARSFTREAARPGVLVGTLLVTQTVMGEWVWNDDDTIDVTYHAVAADFLVNGGIVRIPMLDISQRTLRQLVGALTGDTRPFAIHPKELNRVRA